MDDSIGVLRNGQLVIIDCCNNLTSKLMKKIVCEVIYGIGITPHIKKDIEPESIESFEKYKARAIKEQQYELNKEKYKDERYSIEYCIWRDAVYDKANRTCEDCGKKPKKIHAHHILCWSDNPDKRYSVDNGKCLCIPCHIKYHPWMKKEFKENE